jgi:hypothetical protein
LRILLRAPGAILLACALLMSLVVPAAADEPPSWRELIERAEELARQAQQSAELARLARTAEEAWAHMGDAARASIGALRAVGDAEDARPDDDPEAEDKIDEVAVTAEVTLYEAKEAQADVEERFGDPPPGWLKHPDPEPDQEEPGGEESPLLRLIEGLADIIDQMVETGQQLEELKKSLHPELSSDGEDPLDDLPHWARPDPDPRVDEAKRLLDEAEEIMRETDDLDAARELIDQAKDLMDEVARDREQDGPPDPSRPDVNGHWIDYVNTSIETAERHLDEAQKGKETGTDEPNPFERYIRGDQGGQDKTGATPEEDATPPAEEEPPPPENPDAGSEGGGEGGERKDPDAEASLSQGDTWEQEQEGNLAGTAPTEWTEANQEPVTHPSAITTTAAQPVPATTPVPQPPAEPEPDDWAARLQEQPVDPRPTAPEPETAPPVSPIQSPAIGPGTSAVELLLGGNNTTTAPPQQPEREAQPVLPQVAPVLGPGGVLGLQVTSPMPDKVITTEPDSVKDLLDQPVDPGLSGTRTTPGQPAAPGRAAERQPRPARLHPPQRTVLTGGLW